MVTKQQQTRLIRHFHLIRKDPMKPLLLTAMFKKPVNQSPSYSSKISGHLGDELSVPDCYQHIHTVTWLSSRHWFF